MRWVLPFTSNRFQVRWLIHKDNLDYLCVLELRMVRKGLIIKVHLSFIHWTINHTHIILLLRPTWNSSWPLWLNIKAMYLWLGIVFIIPFLKSSNQILRTRLLCSIYKNLCGTFSKPKIYSDTTNFTEFLNQIFKRYDFIGLIGIWICFCGPMQYQAFC